MTPANVYNTLVQQGATYKLSIAITNPNGTAMNLTGFAARMMIRQDYADVSPVVSITSTPNSDGQLTLGGTLGTVDVLITAVKTATLTPGNYVYDIELVNGTEVTRVLEGKAIVSAEVTK